MGCFKASLLCGSVRNASEITHDDLARTPIALSVSWTGLFHNWTGSLLICNPTRWKEEVRKPALSAFTNRIHHQSRAQAHLEWERGLTKHLLHKINASRLLWVPENPGCLASAATHCLYHLASPKSCLLLLSIEHPHVVEVAMLI